MLRIILLLTLCTICRNLKAQTQAADIVWQNPIGVAVNSSTITKTADGTQWGNAGVNTLNILKNNEVGAIQYKLRNTTTSFAFGLDAVDTSKTRHYTDIKRGFLFNNGSLYIYSNGVVLASLGTAKTNDKLMMLKKPEKYEYFVNNILMYNEARTDTNTLRMEVAMKTYNTSLLNLQLSFYARIQVSSFKQDGAAYDQNTGFIELTTKYGLPPYRYTWSNGSVASVNYDLAPGDYSVSVTDSLYADTVKLKISIGQTTNWADAVNMTFGENEYTKINPDLPASATTANYVEANADGWYEFRLLDMTTDFDFVLQEFTLPEKIKSKFHGVRLVGERLYAILANDVQAPALIAKAGDLIRIGRREGGDIFYINVNGKQVFQEDIDPTKSLIGHLTLLKKFIRITGTLTMAPTKIEGIFTEQCLDLKNSTKITLYDGAGNVVSESVDYFDNMGRHLQTLKRNVSQSNIIAIQTIYDAYGRAVLQTLPAPIFNWGLCYKSDFVTTGEGATAFNYNHFDKPDLYGNSGEQNNPAPLNQSTIGSLGWYYSNNNNVEPFVAAAQNPYSRIEYNSLNTTDIKKMSKAGNHLGHGSGHEQYAFTMPTAGELNYMFGYGGSWTMNDLVMAFTGNDYTGQINPAFYPNAGEIALKEISRDENGVEAVTFTDVKGNVIGSCLAGKQNGVNVKIQQVQGVIKPLEEARRFVDVHLPDGCETSLKLYQNTGSNYIYNIYDLKTGKTILFSGSENYNGTNPSLAPGFYRIYLKSCPLNALSSIPVLQKLNYYNFTLNYYDKANRLKVTVPPNGYDSTYAFLPQIANTGTRVHFNALSNNKTYTGNLATVDWSMNSGSFSNEVSLTMPPPAPFQLSNVITSITYRKDWSTVSMPIGSGSPHQRSATDYYAPINFAEPTVALDTIDFNPPIVGYDSTGAAYYTVPTPGGGGGNPDPCNIILAVPFRFWYQLQDQNGTPLTDIYNNPVTYVDLATCYLHTCQSGASFRTWDLPTPKQFYLSPGQSATITTLKMKISNVLAYTGQPFNSNIIYDLEATIGVNTHQLPGLPQHTMQEINQYDSWDQLLTSYKPDAGRTDYIYSKDGKSRYSQNSKQDASHGNAVSRNFSYINYDAFDRPVEKGEFVPQATYSGSAPSNSYFESYSENLLNGNSADPASVINKADISLDDHFRTHERVAIAYDVPDPDFYTLTGLSATNYKQEYVTGDVSYSYNEQKRTWYSYDELGRTVWMVQRYENTGGLGAYSIKTFNYIYDFLGNVMQIAYQKEDASESFYHYYVYDADKRIKKVYTSRDGLNREEEAAYYYYLHGPLKRVELANKLQGVDYVYAINGWLKNINAPEMDNLRDPGKDGKMNSLVPKDLFGMSLDYFDGDYERASTYVQTYPEPQNSNPSVAPDLFNGIIKAQRWQTKTPAGGSALAYQGQHLFYGYQYDKKYQLKEANFGVWDADGTQNYPVGEGIANDMNINLSNDYKVHSMDYDYNGNIKSLTRNAYAAGAGGIDLDALNYTYLGNSNKLEKVTDAISINPYNSLGYNPGQGSNNFQYNVMGELISDMKGNKAYEYNSFGQIIRVSDLLANPIVEYEYDESGQRVLKRAFNGSNTTTTMYVRDGGGQVMAIYEKTTAAPAYALKEWNIYGSGRIATAYEVGNPQPERVYEVNDHLGNMRTTFKSGLVTSATFNFNGNGTYDYMISDPASTIDNTVNMNGGAGGSIKVVYPSQPMGASIKRIPVKNGQTINVTGYGLYNGSTIPPNSGLQLQLVDENGTLLPGNNIAGAPLGIGAGTWNQFSFSFSITENYPDMYIVLAPVANLSPSNKVAWFDNIQVQLSGTGAGIVIPEQMSVASYYPHGSVMPGLNYNSTLGGRYGYQGQYAELDKEINESFFELRNYNPLTARFNTTDPYEQYHSPYLAMGNNQINHVDPDGGNALSIALGAGGGAVIGGVAGWAIAKGQGLDKADQWKYAGIGAGIGAVVGGVAGSFYNVKIKGGRYDLFGNGLAITKRGSSHFKGFKGTNGFRFGKSNMPWKGFTTHFSVGFRVGNWVLFDIRFNSRNNNKYQVNFPGRWGLNPNSHYRASFLYFVWPKNKGHYKMITGDPNHPFHVIIPCFMGGYSIFTEDPDAAQPSHEGMRNKATD
jgi:RHS repeat-associated protein